MADTYRKRIADRLLAEKLSYMGAVLIVGPKWCGKTATASQAAKSRLLMQNPDKSAAYMMAADTKPSRLLKGDVPRLIDEWQMAPVLWDAVRYEVDRRGTPGQFILTGSAVPTDNAVMHTGTGRIARLAMHTMSLYETGESSGSVSLLSLFDAPEDVDGEADFSIEQAAHAICRGGWPATLNVSPAHSLNLAREYVEAIIEQDVSRIDGVEKNPDRVRALLRSLSRNISTMAANQTLLDDTAGGDTLTAPTRSVYLNALRRIFVIEDQPAWLPSLRSKTAMRTSAKRQFCDPSVAAAVMGLTPAKLLNDFNTFGFLFEALCVHDMRVYTRAIGGDVYHYRDKNNLEADIVLSLHDGRWAAVEVKMGMSQIEEAATNLKKLAAKVDTDKMQQPAFLMVLTAGEFAYRREDGVYVVPLACLAP